MLGRAYFKPTASAATVPNGKNLFTSSWFRGDGMWNIILAVNCEGHWKVKSVFYSVPW